jgi:hypothetical protein
MFMDKFDSKYMSSKVEKDIHSYISDGYKIDCKESIIDPEDKDCTFKAVLKKDVDGIECKTIIKLSESKNSHMYNKVETVGDTKWSEESHSYSTSLSDKDAIFDDKLFTARMKGIADHFNNNLCDYTLPRLSDYIKIKNKSDKSEEPKIKANINGKEVEVKDLHKENITAEPDKSSRTYGLKKASESKARKDWLASKYEPDELEDDLVKLVRYLFNR